MFHYKQFLALAGIEDELMQLFFTKAEDKGLNPTFDIYHVMAGDEKPKPEEIEIMEQVYRKYIKDTPYYEFYKTAIEDFPERLRQKNLNRMKK